MKAKLNTLMTRSRNILLYGKYIPTEYFVNHEKKMVYIPIPKVACTAIKLALYDRDLNNTDKYQDYMDIHTRMSNKQTYQLTMREKKYFKFAFVRDPFSRLVSCYKDKVVKQEQHNGKYYFDSGYNNILIKNISGKKFYPEMSFAEFVELVCKIPDVIADGHFMSQTAFLYCHGNKIPDYIGRLEKMNEQWGYLSDQYNLSALSIKNKTEEDNFVLYYKEKYLIDLVYKRYKEDVDKLDYHGIYNFLRSS